MCVFSKIKFKYFQIFSIHSSQSKADHIRFFFPEYAGSDVAEKFPGVVHISDARKDGRCDGGVEHHIGDDQQPFPDKIRDDRESGGKFIGCFGTEHSHDSDHLGHGFYLAPDVGGDDFSLVGGNHPHGRDEKFPEEDDRLYNIFFGNGEGYTITLDNDQVTYQEGDEVAFTVTAKEKYAIKTASAFVALSGEEDAEDGIRWRKMLPRS